MGRAETPPSCGNGAGAQNHSALKAVLEIAEAALKYISHTKIHLFFFFFSVFFILYIRTFAECLLIHSLSVIDIYCS